MEYSGFSRGRDPFPKHWRGMSAAQDSETRAAIIITNMALDLEARGDRANAEKVRQAFINGSDPDAPSPAEVQRAYVENPSAANALALAKSLAR